MSLDNERPTESIDRRKFIKRATIAGGAGKVGTFPGGTITVNVAPGSLTAATITLNPTTCQSGPPRQSRRA